MPITTNNHNTNPIGESPMKKENNITITEDDFLDFYWKYYLELEKEYLKIEEYIPTDNKNFNIYSIKYTKLLLGRCSEVDSVFKIFIKFLDVKQNPENMGVYRQFITKKYQNFSKEHIKINTGKEIIPFKNFCNKSPEWWKDYNTLKHQRHDHENYNKANQKNALYSLAGLYQLETYFYYEIIKNKNRKIKLPLPQSKIFRLKGYDEPPLIDNRYTLYVHNGCLMLEGIDFPY